MSMVEGACPIAIKVYYYMRGTKPVTINLKLEVTESNKFSSDQVW